MTFDPSSACTVVAWQLAAYAHNLLETDAMSTVNAHLATCAACRARLQMQQQFDTALRQSLPLTEQPFSRREILAMQSLSAAPRFPLRPAIRPFAGGIVVAALLISLFFIVTKNASPSVGSLIAPTATVAITPTATLSAPWAQLAARPLRLPSLAAGAPCPTEPARTVTPAYGPALGSGPVYLVGAGDFTAAANWAYDKTFWVMDPAHHEDILVRGQQLDGSHHVQFSGGLDQLYLAPNQASPIPQLRLSFAIVGGATGSSWHDWIAYTRIQAPGCYAVQIDGASFSEVIIFHV